MRIELLDGGHVRYIAHMGDDLTPAEVARISTGSEGTEDKNLKLIENLWNLGHHAPFEFCMLDIELCAPIFVLRQIRTHRLFSYCERSLRYTASDLDCYDPDPVGGIYAKAYQLAHRSYQALLALGVPKERARLVLPMATYSTMRMAGNLRSWLHFLDLRDDRAAQQETRIYARAIAEIIADRWPAIYRVYQSRRLP